MISGRNSPFSGALITVLTTGSARVQELRISVAELLGHPGALRDLQLRAPMEGVATALAWVTEAPVRADLRAESVMEGILITGRVRATTGTRCARCLVEFPSSVDLEVCELFAASGHAGEEDDYRVSGTEVDLEPMLRDALTLALPLHPLCRQGCKGICARCGADLNAGECACTDEHADPRWAPLESLRAQLEERGTA
jgi:uncharacterized protein